MARRIEELANELGVSAEEIVRKCLAEGIPPTIIKDHNSTVSAGLEAVIRAWLAGRSDDSGEFSLPPR